QLEGRLLLSTIQQVTALGSLTGRKYLPDQFLSKNNSAAHENIYQFSLVRDGRIDVQLSRLNFFLGEDCNIVLGSATQSLLASSFRVGPVDENISLLVPAGDYFVKVTNAAPD